MMTYKLQTILCIVVFFAAPQAWAASESNANDMKSEFRNNGFTAWNCESCGLKNSGQQLTCQACFEMRPTPIELFNDNKLETLVSGVYRQMGANTPFEAAIIRKTMSNIHGECAVCGKPLSVSDMDLIPFDCDHSFHQKCLLNHGESETLVGLFKKFKTDGSKCPVESCPEGFNTGNTDIGDDFLAFTKDGSKTLVNFSDYGKTVYVEGPTFGDDPLYSIEKKWNASGDLKSLIYSYYWRDLYPPRGSHYAIPVYHDNGNPRIERVSHKGSIKAKEYYADGNLKHKGAIGESGNFDGYGTRYEYPNDQKTAQHGIFKNGEFEKDAPRK
eukprot:1074705_1